MIQIRIIDQTGNARIVAALPAIAKALERQCNEEFASAWNTSQVCVEFASDGKEKPGTWPCYVQKTLDDPEALAYHMTIDGYPVMRVGTDAILSNGGTISSGALSISAAMSHEFLETLADDFCDVFALLTEELATLCAQNGIGPNGVDFEVADPVQGDSYDGGDGIALSNFVTPEWFRDGASMQGYDHMGVVSSPGELAPGGYVGFSDGSQIFAREVPDWKREQVKKFGRRRRHPRAE